MLRSNRDASKMALVSFVTIAPALSLILTRLTSVRNCQDSVGSRGSERAGLDKGGVFLSDSVLKCVEFGVLLRPVNRCVDVNTELVKCVGLDNGRNGVLVAED